MKRCCLLAFAMGCCLLFPASSRCQDDAEKTATEPVYEIGGEVKPPRQTYAPGPEYTDKARKKHERGLVVLKLVVGSDGRTRDIKVVNSLSKELDGAAVDAVKKWKFTPATKDGQPVAVHMSVEVTFNIR
jgi:protein TonB